MMLRVNTSDRINMRAAPSTSAEIVLELRDGMKVERVVGCTLARDGFDWTFCAHADAAGRYVSGWVARVWPTWEQQFTLAEAGGAASYPEKPDNSPSLWPTPIQGRYVVTQEFGNGGHLGADLAGAVGLPITAADNGLVVKVGLCSRCTADRPNFASQGVGLWDAKAIADPAWGYGFGNYVIVRYDRPDRALYVVYAHLSAVRISEGSHTHRGAPLGLLGNTGNSSGAHLHLEVRVSPAPTTGSIFQLPAVNPREVFAL